jgi:hypothetical protein
MPRRARSIAIAAVAAWALVACFSVSANRPW